MRIFYFYLSNFIRLKVSEIFFNNDLKTETEEIYVRLLKKFFFFRCLTSIKSLTTSDSFEN